MTVNNCIAYIDSIEPNAYTAAQKAMWISECEGKVYTDLFLLQPNEFTPVVYDADKDRTLALPAPYDRLYPRYLQAMIHYANGEYDRYANSMAAFNEVWGGLHRWFGANYDVSDRRRNRRVEASVSTAGGRNQLIFSVPQGCALVGGRILVRKEDTFRHSNYTCADTLAAGTYNIKIGKDWVHFTTTESYPADTEITCGPDYTGVDVDPPGDSNTDHYINVSGRDADGTDLEFTTPLRIGFGDDVIVTIDPQSRSITPVPMLVADRGGTGLETKVYQGDTSWNETGEILFTARLLVPDEEFPFN